MASDGTGARALVDRPGRDEVFPRWLPDGSGVVHATFATQQQTATLGVVRADGTGARDLDAGPGNETDADPVVPRRPVRR